MLTIRHRKPVQIKILFIFKNFRSDSKSIPLPVEDLDMGGIVTGGEDLDQLPVLVISFNGFLQPVNTGERSGYIIVCDGQLILHLPGKRFYPETVGDLVITNA
jgi:hypothetical protein